MQHKPNNQYYQYGSNVIFWLHEAAHCIKKAKRIIIVFTTILLFSHMDGGGSWRSRVERGGRLLMGVSCCDPLTSPKSFSIFWPFFFHYFTFTWVILTLKADNTSNQLKREKCCTLFKSALFLTPMIFGKTKGWFQFWAWSCASYFQHYNSA